MTDYKREPTIDESAGMMWWNGLTDVERGRWLEIAHSTVPADAWAAVKRAQVEEHQHNMIKSC
jgi:hypothetical protein